ncbi:hypothetical protein TrRE_jg2265 [Triparma retinervis]|uniref:Transmembrane protein n=1 Tax=Triparma retinervis TaxID=2557542 RepID=A0A9W7FWN9_9STRA|nr:hypothetical protein TrRE_jg2265 [Triparma retinervis]
MSRIIILISLILSVSSFSPTPLFGVTTSLSLPSPRSPTSLLADDGKERGVSIDQDGKSNVWAIEPKMEVESKSGGEKRAGAIVAIVALGAAVAAAGGVLGNLPDPNQF